MRFIRRLIIATAQWVALLSIFVVTGFAIAATLAGAYFCLVEIAYNTRQQSEPR